MGPVYASIISAGPKTIQAFLDGDYDLNLVDMYGDPVRGFAGGYEPAH
jgi:hypothetical protein